MNSVLQFFKDFGNIINTALLMSLLALAFTVFRATIEQKDAELAALRERLKATELFSVENVAEKYQALKDFYEVNLKDWYEASIKSLEDEKQKAVAHKEKEFQQLVEREIKRRDKIIERLSTFSNRQLVDTTLMSTRLSITDICGIFAVTGHNPHSKSNHYYGELKLTANGEVITAEWQIGPKKSQQTGVGLLTGNIRSISFMYTDFRGDSFTGIVSYEFITRDVMRGTWTGRKGSTLGFEEGLRADSSAT